MDLKYTQQTHCLPVDNSLCRRHEIVIHSYTDDLIFPSLKKKGALINNIKRSWEAVLKTVRLRISG